MLCLRSGAVIELEKFEWKHFVIGAVYLGSYLSVQLACDGTSDQTLKFNFLHNSGLLWVLPCGAGLGNGTSLYSSTQEGISVVAETSVRLT